jgi:metallo-beta-lactamase class B
MAEIKQLTGAQMLMHEGDVDLLESGGGQDFRFPEGRGSIYPPIKVDRRLKDGDRVRLGETELTVLHHPGHTKGATSFTYTTEDGGRKYEVLIVNMPSINPGVTVGYMPGYPQINEAYLTTLAKQKQLKPQVWVSSHAGHFDMHQKYKPGDPYDPNRFVDPEGYQKKIQSYERLFNEAYQREREAKTSR